MKFERLGNIVNLISGYAFKSELFNEEGRGMPLIRVRDVNSGFAGIYYSGEYDQLFVVKNGDLLVGLDGDFNCIEWKYGDALLNQRVCKIEPNEEKVSRDYILHYLPKTLNDIHKTTNYTTVKHLSTKTINEIRILLPTLPTQIHIANILTKAENLISPRKESLRLLDEYLKSKFLEMFGDPVRNEKGWDKVEICKLGKVITGNTPSRKVKENYSSSYIEWIKTDNIVSDKLYITEASEYLSEQGVDKGRYVESGALLVACIAGSIESVGRAALTDRKVSFNQQINAIQPFNDVSPLFLYWLFKVSKPYVQSHAAKGMKKLLVKSQFESIKMIKPPLPIQEKFAQIVEKTESLKAQYQQSLQELENLYGSLSQRAFKGELTPKEYKQPNDYVQNSGLGMAAEP